MDKYYDVNTIDVVCVENYTEHFVEGERYELLVTDVTEYYYITENLDLLRVRKRFFIPVIDYRSNIINDILR